MNNDIKNLAKYPEFHALKKELLTFCDKMDNISDIELNRESRVSLNEEIFGRLWASDKVKELLSQLGMVDQSDIKKQDKTFE